MFRATATATEPAPVGPAPDDDPIPISHLALDLDTPAAGWDGFLASRNIPTVLDDLGRRSVSRGDARQLILEKQAGETHAREVAQRNERAAVERDRRWRAQLHPGIPAGMFGDVDPIRAQIAAEIDADPRRREMDEELWGRKFGRGGADELVTVYHPIRGDGGES